jgi:RimJ/RimL family protein N-acetyltransferase
LIVDDERVALYVSQKTGVAFVPPFYAIGLEMKGEIVAAALFNVFEGADVHVSIAGHRWTKGFAADIGHYVFDRLKCERMTGITEQPSVVRLGERLGGQLEGCMRNHFGKGRDAFIIGILKEDWKF